MGQTPSLKFPPPLQNARVPADGKGPQNFDDRQPVFHPGPSIHPAYFFQLPKFPAASMPQQIKPDQRCPELSQAYRPPAGSLSPPSRQNWRIHTIYMRAELILQRPLTPPARFLRFHTGVPDIFWLWIYR